MTGIQYIMSVPQGSTADYVGNASYRGFGFETRKFTKSNFSFGLSLSWNVFDEVIKNELVDLDYGQTVGAHAYGTQERFVNSFPILVNAHYYLGRKRSFNPYFGINAGAYRINQRTYFGVFGVDENNWHLGFAPEVGFTMPFGYNMAGQLSVKYHYALAAGKVEDQSYIALTLGLLYF